MPEMKRIPDEAVAEAFALSRARGAELLVRLGDFDVWRGDLTLMRSDSSRREQPDDEAARATTEGRLFADSLVLARAIELLPPVCRAALSAAYASGEEATSSAGELDTDPAHVERILADCRERLGEIYETLACDTTHGEVTIPEWVAEREHASAGDSRRRG